MLNKNLKADFKGAFYLTSNYLMRKYSIRVNMRVQKGREKVVRSTLLQLYQINFLRRPSVYKHFYRSGRFKFCQEKEF